MKNYATIGGIAAICVCILWGEDIADTVERTTESAWDGTVDAFTTSNWERKQNEKAAYELESARLRWIYRECSLKGTNKYYNILEAYNFKFDEAHPWSRPHKDASAKDIKYAYWELRGELGYWAWDRDMRFSATGLTVGLAFAVVIGSFSRSSKKAKAEPKTNGPVAKLRGTNYEWKKS